MTQTYYNNVGCDPYNIYLLLIPTIHVSEIKNSFEVGITIKNGLKLWYNFLRNYYFTKTKMFEHGKHPYV